jgi:membrane protein
MTESRTGPDTSPDRDALPDRDAERQAKGATDGRLGGVKRLFDISLATYLGYKKDQGLVLSAALAYYALFAMGPIALLTISIAGFVVGEQAASGSLSSTLDRYLGEELTDTILAALTGGLASKYATTFTLLSAGFLLYGAVRLFLRLQGGSNLMWGVRIKPRTETKKLVFSRLFLLVATIVPGLLLVASFLLSSVVSWLSGPMGPPLNIFVDAIQRAAPTVVTWLATTVLFVMLPDVRLSLRDVWRGALLTAVALIVGTDIFGIYLSWGGSSSFYGAAGAILALLLWTHYMAIIIVIGTRFTRVMYERAGKQIRPSPYAVRVEEIAYTGHDEEQQGSLQAKSEDAG